MKEERRRVEVEVFVLVRESHSIRVIKCSKWMNSLAHGKLCKHVFFFSPGVFFSFYISRCIFAAAPQVLSSLAPLTCDAPAWVRIESLNQRGDVTKCTFLPRCTKMAAAHRWVSEESFPPAAFV